MEVSRAVVELYRVWIALAAVPLALLWPRLSPRVRRGLLAALTVFSLANYSRFGLDTWVRRVDAYDLLHYYVNAKYMDELGYLDLYPAMLLADAEHDGPFFPAAKQYMAQDESGHHLESIASGVERGRVVRETKFTPERWAAFEHDVLYLQRDIGCRDRNRKEKCLRELDDELWLQLVNDHGFNGTTAWTLLAEPIAKAVPVEWIKALGQLDIIVLAVAFGVVAWAYGVDVTLWGILFFLVTYSTRWPYLSWVFLRYDWVAGLLIATALLKRASGPVVVLFAGVAAGWTATLRMFPAMWMWGPFARGLWGLWEGEVRRPLLVFAGGFLLAVGLLQGAATVRYGSDRVVEHFENMQDHNKPQQLSSRRIGLALLLATEPWKGTATERVITPDRKALIERQMPLRYGIGLAVVLMLGWALRRKGNDEAYAWGFLPFFLFTTASYYYYVARIPLTVVHAGGLDRPRHRAGLAMLFAIEAMSSAAETWATGHRLFLIGNLAWSLGIYAIVQVGWMIAEDAEDRR